ncbi:testis anion transporter 1 isoform X5 [Fukomys damarensis]|uniref:testis anion transporter 1 isoform X5 n=1 Tax=Fukomys damarensis TaxID=885580 RepID=UPI00053FD412|nr:testis anion transporter 1 isoform X5 [Fukomys damarensis]
MTKPEKGNQNSTSKSRLNSFLYKIKRDVYNEESFQQEYRKTAPSTGTMNTDVATIRHQVLCHCSWHKFLRCMVTIFPFLEWMCLYRFKDWLLGDLLAGLSVGLVQVPQGLVLSLLTRQLVPPLNVAYAAFCSSVVYVIFGSCHQMSIGPFFLVSALMINVLKEKPFNKGHLILGTFLKDDFTVPSYFDNYNKSLSVVAATTFLTGLIQLSMGLLGMGFMATYLPEAVISAYLAAVALHLVLSQLPCVFGVMITFHAGPVAFFYNILNYCVALPKANSTSILLFLTAVVALRINKCIRISFNHYPIEFPMELFLILGFTVFANKIDMATENSKTFAEMTPFRFLFPTLPDFTIFGKVVLQSISLSLVSSFLLIFLGKRIASFHNYRVNSNQDLIAIGLCNVISSCFRTSVFTGAMARTIIQDKSGGRQQFASLVGAGVMLLLMVKVGSFFYELPNIAYTERYEYQEDFSSSSGNLIHCTPLEPTTLSQKTSDEETPSQRYHGEICEDVGKGWPSSNTLQKSVPSPQDPGAAPAERRLNAPCSDVTVQPATHTIILDFSLVHYVDSQALVILRQMCNAFQNASILVLFTGCHSCVLREFEKNDFFDDGITKAHLFLSLHDAVLFALSRNAADGSELSVEEGETVLQETYSEPDKAFKRQKTGTENDKSRYEKSCGFLESSRNTSQRFPKVQKPKEESLAFDLGLDDTGESAEPSGLDLSLDLDQVLDNELGLEPELEPHMDLEWERQPDPRSRAHVYPPQHFRPMYHAPAQGSQPQLSPRMRSAEKRQKYLDSDSPEGSKEEVWEVN